jgi:probable phosphoglycerate mutase
MIIFARHGNTFEPGTAAVWVGAKTDLPLASEGLNQAMRVADHLKSANISPKTVIAGPLRRTTEFAGIVAKAFGCPVQIDEDLVELDYGFWEGKDNAAIEREFGHDRLEAWEKRLEWPSDGGWGEGRTAVESRIRSFIARLSQFDSPIFVCTSNGIMRFVRFILDGTTGSSAKVRTGAFCELTEENGALSVIRWDVRP